MSAVRSPSLVVAGSPAYAPSDVSWRYASGAPQFDPATIANIVDYGIWTDTSKLKQNSDGSTDVTTAGQVVGWWQGQLGVLTFIQPTTANKPTYEADGIQMWSNPSNQKMYASRVTPWNAAFSMGMRQVATTGARGSFMSTAFSTFFTDRFFGLWDMADPNKTAIIRGTKTTLEPNGVTEINTVLTYDGSSAAAGYKSDGTKVTATVGGSTGSSDQYIHIGAASGTVESAIKGWIVVNGQMSDQDVANWRAFVGALP